MDWNDWQSILRWRAIEEGDTDGALLSEERRAEATARTRAGLSAENVSKDPAGARETSFLLRRARWLEQEVVGCNGSLVRIIERLSVASGSKTWIWLGWAAAAVIGYALAGFGQDVEFNLLALPLVGLLAWNLVIMLISLVMEFQKESSSAWLEWLAGKLARQNGERGGFEGDPPTGLTVDQRFALLANAPAMERWQRRFRAWLHIAAALLALGSAVGLYARGWSKEYRAVWESTLLNETQAQSFFGGLFTPASSVLRLPLPLDQLPAMHRTGGVAKTPAPALPWIHLYAGTLLVLVILPRLLLAGLTAWRAHQVINRRMLSLGWNSYLVRTLRRIEGGQEIITVLVHGTDATPGHREVWSRGVRERFGQMSQCEFVSIHLGDEDDFAASWKPSHPRVVMVFNLATTPEAEVQRRFVLDVKQSLMSSQRAAELLVLLDATSIGNRWSPEKLASREKLWADMIQGSGVEIIVAARRGGI
ncbi:DUF2868 domain-containing protein [Brevifollis gellanilyticus]|uniref:DUF2868 domain-containing protein n=1 Tax=Brevifollis gellanilyticus TaxID=748831 RepID=A0A512M359_9BACT|nr:DUF2868 domain-containing protein [Brevifollis gellanilyticus]GEP41162.1 hypothetical protein BGE01nite_04530 [Brevifollis gellanilyticus]